MLKNGHPAHVFTDEDRRKAAAITNEIRREKRELFELARLNQEIEWRLAADEERRSDVAGAARSGVLARAATPAQNRHSLKSR